MSDEALRVESCGVRYGGVVALDDVSFVARRGEVLGFIGPNGAGKTTLFDVVSGFVRPTSGRILLGDVDVTGLAPERRARLGLGRSFQDARLFPSLTVKQNLQVAFARHTVVGSPVAVAGGIVAQRDEEARIDAQAEELIDLLGIAAFRDKFASELSTGSRRVVDLAMVLAHRPEVLLLDEPSSGIAQRETEALAPLIRRIREQLRCTILVIEHDMPLISSISDAIIALEAGRTITAGPPRAVLHDARVIAAYLGGDPATVNRSGRGEAAPSPPPVVAADSGRIPAAPRGGAIRLRRGVSWAQRTGAAAAVLLAAACVLLARFVSTPGEAAPEAAAAPLQPPSATAPAQQPAVPSSPAASFAMPALPVIAVLPGSVPTDVPVPTFAPTPPPQYDDPTPPPSPSPSILDQLCLVVPLTVCPSPLPVEPPPAPTALPGVPGAPSSSAGAAQSLQLPAWLQSLVFTP